MKKHIPKMKTHVKRKSKAIFKENNTKVISINRAMSYRFRIVSTIEDLGETPLQLD